MNGFRREQTTDRDLQLNQGIAESSVDALGYSWRFSPTVLFPAAGAVLNMLGPAPYMAYPKAGTPAGRMGFPAPTALWAAGTLTARLIWSGDTASTNVVAWQVNMTLTRAGGVPTVVSGPLPGVPGPSVVNALQDYTFVAASTFWPVDPSIIHIGVNIFRNGGIALDTYAGEARLFGFEIVYTPVAGH